MRTAKVILVIGARNRGKTVFTKKLLEKYKSPAKLIIDTFDNPVWRDWGRFDFPEGQNIKIPAIPVEYVPRLKNGTFRTFSSDSEELFSCVENGLKNAVVVWEDATKILEGRLDQRVKKIVIDSKQKSLDLVFVFHSLGAVPPKLVRNCDIIVLFNTNEGSVDKNKYPFPDIEIAMEHLKKSTNRYEYVTIQTN